MDTETQDAFKLLGAQINEGFNDMRQDMNRRFDIVDERFNKVEANIKEIRTDILRVEKRIIEHYKTLSQHGIAIRELQKC